MTQRTTGLYALLRFAGVFDLFQRAVGAARMTRCIVQEHVRPRAGERLLDVGCGTGAMLFELPDVDYVGVDLSPEYIAAARRLHPGRGTFIASDVARLASLRLDPFNAIVMIGLLHHLDDVTVSSLFDALAPLLRPGGRLVVVEPCLHSRQSRLERALMARDRGAHIRMQEDYRALANTRFGNGEQTLVRNVLLIPWTLTALTLRDPILSAPTPP